MKRSLLMLLLMLTEFLFFCSTTFAENDPLPNDSTTAALFFGDIETELPLITEDQPQWESGMSRSFNVLEINSGTITQCIARIFLITPNIVFWCDTDHPETIPDEITDALKKFDTELLPILHSTFGEEASPGIDNDPRFHVLFTEKIGDGYNGYFSSDDSADPRLHPNSNGMELVFLNAKLLSQNSLSILDTLAHEVQHMIHHAYDPNETGFVNEGFSGLAEYAALRYVREPFIHAYLSDTGKSLIWWPDSGNTTPYYGSSFLFSVYLYDRFGQELICSMTASPGNGLDGLNEALQASGYSFNADEVFQQWSAALLSQLDRNSVPEWDYRSYEFPQEGITRDIQTLSCGNSEMHETGQYGLRFYRSGCSSPFRISVLGAAESSVTGLTVPSGEYAWWGGAASNSLAYLRHAFDFSDVAGDIFFEYDVNFNIETDYDYYYLLLEDENGKIVRLSPSTATGSNPAGQNRGSGTTGTSEGVLHEVISLNSWAGQSVRISFVYLTDTAGVSDGILLDNFQISAIGFYDNAEINDNGWESAGFFRIASARPQRWSLTVLHPKEDSTSAAEFFTFNGGDTITVDCPEGECTFGISAIDPAIRSRASFTVQTEQVP